MTKDHDSLHLGKNLNLNNKYSRDVFRTLSIIHDCALKVANFLLKKLHPRYLTGS